MTGDPVVLTAAEGADAANIKTALERAAEAGVAVVIMPPRGGDVLLSRAEASDHQKYKAALAKANAQGGVVVVL